MRIPNTLKISCILVYFIKEEEMKQPEMLRPVRIKAVKAFQSLKEDSPSPDKLGPYFNPETLNTGIMGGARIFSFSFSSVNE
jgi:hypothetical protein